MKKGFTLAEIMIVLAVIGVLTAVLLPVAINSTPNEDIMKFKKGHNALLSTIRELVNSDEYYGEDLGYKPDGNNISTEKDSDIVYFCKTFAEMLNTKSVNCGTQNNTDGAYISLDWEVNKIGYITSGKNSIPEILDYYCEKNQSNVNPEIVTSDDIVYFQVSPTHTFGAFSDFKYDTPIKKYLFRAYWNGVDGANCVPSGDSYVCTSSTNPEPEGGSYYFIKEDGTAAYAGTSPIGKTIYMYKTFCMDIDGIGEGEDPFGYGIRIDGKVMLGARADEWLQKSIQEKE